MFKWPFFDIHLTNMLAETAGAVEYTDCISAERQDSLNECLGYGTKQSDGEAGA